MCNVFPDDKHENVCETAAAKLISEVRGNLLSEVVLKKSAVQEV